MAVVLFPVLLLVVLVLMGLVYWKTKSIAKVGYLLEIVLAVFTYIFATQISDTAAVTPFTLLALGLVLNGIIGLAS